MAKVRKWRGNYMLDFYDDKGERQRKVLPKGTKKKQATDKLKEIVERLERGIYMPEIDIPIFEKTAEQWLEYKKPNLRDSTWSVYEGHTRNHFDDLKPLKVNRITTATIEKYITDRQNEGMHILTLRKILVTLNGIMAYAVRHGYAFNNPVRDAERPKGQGGVEKKVIRVLNVGEIKKLLDAVTGRKYRTLFTLAIMTGARQGELFGLKWSDIDWHNSQIHVQRTFNNQKWYKPKSKTSDRRIDIGPSVVAELKRWRLASRPNPRGIVFPNEAGQPLNHNNVVNRYFEPALKKAELGKVRFHDLRHTFASLLIEQGENIKYIQTQLGHSSPTVTLNVYAHLMKPVNQEAACRLENTVFSPTGQQMGNELKNAENGNR